MNEDEPWIARATALLDRSVEALDAHTLSRLNRARQAALAQRGASHAWKSGGIALAALAIVVAVGVARREPAPAALPAPLAGSVDPLAADEDFDLYDDLDFYAWLDAERDGGHG